MKLQLEIKIGNDTVQNYNDVFSILAEQANQIAMGDFGNPFSEPLVGEGRDMKDTNGNTVGQWEIIA